MCYRKTCITNTVLPNCPSKYNRFKFTVVGENAYFSTPFNIVGIKLLICIISIIFYMLPSHFDSFNKWLLPFSLLSHS